MKIELENLIGEHLLSGVDNIQVDETEPIDAILFILDGVTYMAIEDPDDGYRSMLAELKIVDRKVNYMFPPQKVIAKMAPDTTWEVNNILQFYDATTNKLVMEIGTGNWEDYYPYFVFRWLPENLAINKNNEKIRIS